MRLDLGTIAIIVLVFGAIAVAAVAIVLVMVERRGRAHDKRAQEKLRDVFEKTASYTVESVEYICTFDESGSGTSERRIHGLRATQRIQNLEIPYASKLPDPKAGAQMVGVTLTTLPDSTVTLRWQEDTEQREGGSIHGTIIVDDLLTPDAGVAAYSVQQQHKFGFAMTEQDAEKQYKDADWKKEYVTYSAQVPGVKELTIVVNFPGSHHHLMPPPSGVAFLAGLEVADQEETPLVRDRVQYDNGVATLVVENPTPLVRYAITWTPPPRQ